MNFYLLARVVIPECSLDVTPAPNLFFIPKSVPLFLFQMLSQAIIPITYPSNPSFIFAFAVIHISFPKLSFPHVHPFCHSRMSLSGIQRSRSFRSRPQNFSDLTVTFKHPIFSIFISIKSPSSRKVPFAAPTPEGVPVLMISPGFSVAI